MKKLTTEEFIGRSQNTHSYKYNYSESEYVNKRTKLKIICPTHGEFWQGAGRHIMGEGCPSCANNITKTTESFIEQAKSIHGDKYDYSQVDYVNNIKIKVKIVCREHGEFWQIPKDHLKGCGCPKCGNNRVSVINGENPVGWTLSNWKNSAEKSKGFDSFKVYIIECWNEYERFYKIGKTFQTVGRRFRGKSVIPYKWKLVYKLEGDAETMFKLENELKKENKIFKYTPKLEFDGMYECFSKIDING